MSFKDFVSAVVNTPIKYPHLRNAMLAQSIMESGRETTDLAKLHNNHHGIKWRDEMQGYATPVEYKTDSEPTGSATFCKFTDKQAAVNGYWKFLTRSPYAGWENHIKSGEEFLAFICRIWCPAGYTDSWKQAHGGQVYHEYVINNLLPEANALILEEEKNNKPANDTSFWLEIYKNGKAYVIGEPSGKAHALFDTERACSNLELLGKFAAKNGCGTFAVAPADKPEPILNQDKPEPNGKKILLDPGHSRSTVGARSNDGSVKEELLNELQAQIIADYLKERGYVADIYNPDPDNLTEVGKRAKGYDAFVSLHHNSYSGAGTQNNGAGPYTCVMVLPEGSSKASSKRLAASISASVAKAISVTNFSGTDGELGVYHAGLSVLRAAEPVCAGPCVLVESYFLNAQKSMGEASTKSKTAAYAIAQAIDEFFK